MFRKITLLAILAVASITYAQATDPFASNDAVKGGQITLSGLAPKSINYYLDNNSFSAEVFGLLYETLLTNDPLTTESAPNIASSWEISADKRSFTFHIDPLARWSDGKPITADDVIWTFQTITAKESQTGPIKVALKTFTNVEKLSPNTIRFTASEVHWRNLDAASGFPILPKHAFQNRDFNKLNSNFTVVSGPYTLSSIKEGISYTLKRRPDWWQSTRPNCKNIYNFDTIQYRVFANQENAFEAFLAGELDFYPVYTASIWSQRATGKKFLNHWAVKCAVKNHKPIGFQGFAINLRREPFSDLRVRKALAYLLDRDRMNRTLMHNQYFLHRSYFENIYDSTHPCTNETFTFNPQKAAKLLDEAGYTLDPKTNLRTKNGTPLTFTFLTRDTSSDKFLALYNEDLKNAGITMKIEREDWAAWARDMDTFNFDMTWAAWSSGLRHDPEDMWSSKEATSNGGNNITGYCDPTVDALIDKQRTIFDLEKRNEILRQIDAHLTSQVPYILLWNADTTRLLYWNKFGTPKTILSKYGDESSATAYWWYDEDSAIDLQDAQENDEPLPAPPETLSFDDIFNK